MRLAKINKVEWYLMFSLDFTAVNLTRSILFEVRYVSTDSEGDFQYLCGEGYNLDW